MESTICPLEPRPKGKSTITPQFENVASQTNTTYIIPNKHYMICIPHKFSENHINLNKMRSAHFIAFLRLDKQTHQSHHNCT